MNTQSILAATVVLFGFTGAALADGGVGNSNDWFQPNIQTATVQQVQPTQSTRTFGYPQLPSLQTTESKTLVIPEGYGFSMGQIKSLNQVYEDQMNYGQ